MTDEELSLGARRRLPRMWLGVAVAAAVTIGALVFAAGRGSHSHAAPAAGSPTAGRLAAPPTPAAVIDTEATIQLPRNRHRNADQASDVFGGDFQGDKRNPDGTVTWALILDNEYGLPVRLSERPHIHIAADLHADVLGVQVFDERHSPVSPDTNIGQDGALQIQLLLRFDCSHVDPATTPFPKVPVAVVLSVFGFPGTAAFALRPTLDSGTQWQEVC